VRFRSKRLFVIPEEMNAPVELMATVNHLNATSISRSFVDAVVDPTFNSLMCATGKRHPTRSPAAIRLREKMIEALLTKGPTAVPDVQKNALLADPVFLSRLHFDVWTSAQANGAWQKATGLKQRDGEPQPLPHAA
jgi:membrane glycosyltransferase